MTKVRLKNQGSTQLFNQKGEGACFRNYLSTLIRLFSEGNFLDNPTWSNLGTGIRSGFYQCDVAGAIVCLSITRSDKGFTRNQLSNMHLQKIYGEIVSVIKMA